MANNPFCGERIRLPPPKDPHSAVAYNTPIGKRRIEPDKEKRGIVAVYVESQESFENLRFDPAPHRQAKTQPLGTPTDRFSLYLSEVIAPSDVVASGPVPQVNFELRITADAGSVMAVSGKITPPSWGYSGFLVQFAGLLAIQWEFWASVDLQSANPVAIDWVLTGVLDRSGSDPSVIVGPNVVKVASIL